MPERWIRAFDRRLSRKAFTISKLDGLCSEAGIDDRKHESRDGFSGVFPPLLAHTTQNRRDPSLRPVGKPLTLSGPNASRGLVVNAVGSLRNLEGQRHVSSPSLWSYEVMISVSTGVLGVNF